VIRLALASLVLVVGLARAERPQPVASKKDREHAAKTKSTARPPRPGTRPAAVINVYNSWTHEWLAVTPGAPPPQATIDRFLRDHFTNQPTQMEPRLVEILTSAATKFKSDVVIVVSAFRHPKYNLILRKKGHQVARNSEHTHGNAVDFYIPRVPTRVLHAWAKRQELGGVGLYLRSGFIHMDTGRIRYWSGE